MSDVMRAAKLANLPGVTIAEACKRFGVAKAAVTRARREHAKTGALAISVAEHMLAALTRNGAGKRGKLGDLGRIASWIDYINKDGCTVADVRAGLATFEVTGQLTIDGDRWTLHQAWP